MALETEPESEPEQEEQQQQQTKKKKRTTGLASASAADIKRVTQLGQIARIEALKRMKQESDEPLKMGLAGATPEIRKRVAHLGGLARAADKAGLAKAGKLGGEVVRSMYGLEFYREIGKKGAALKESYSMEIISDIAAKRKKKDKKKGHKQQNA